jgi:hypothetical protein
VTRKQAGENHTRLKADRHSLEKHRKNAKTNLLRKKEGTVPMS